MSRILITGGAGFIGSHLAASSLAAGHTVHVVVRPRSDDARLDELGDRIVRHRFDLRQEEELQRCLADVEPEAIFHLAGSPRRPCNPDLSDMRDFVREELDALLFLLRSAAGVRRPPSTFVRAGSIAEYGSAPTPHYERQREAPVTAYSAAMVAAAQIVSAVQPRLPFPVATARLALVYGPTQSADYLIPQLILRCLAGQQSVVRRPCDRRDLIFVEDAASALLRLAFAPTRGAPVINIATGDAPMMSEVADMIVGLTGSDPKRVTHLKDSAPEGAAELRCSTALARDALGWRAGVALRDGLERTIRWYRRRSQDMDARPAALGDRDMEQARLEPSDAQHQVVESLRSRARLQRGGQRMPRPPGDQRRVPAASGV